MVPKYSKMQVTKILALLLITFSYGETLKCFDCKGNLQSSCAFPIERLHPLNCADEYKGENDFVCATLQSKEMNAVARTCLLKVNNGTDTCDWAVKITKRENNGIVPKDLICSTCEQDACV